MLEVPRLLGSATAIAALGFLSACIQVDSTPAGNASARAGNATAQTNQAAGAVTGAPAGAATTAPPAAAPTSWNYHSEKDPMTDGVTYTACTTSTNQVALNPPYGTVNADLCIRQSPKYGLDVIVQLDGDGQFMCPSYEDCRVNVRFGSTPQQHWTATGPADNSTTSIFLRNQGKAVAALKTAPTTLVEATFYDAGDQTMQFNTAGLVWPPKQ
jgi:hypothetical protein